MSAANDSTDRDPDDVALTARLRALRDRLPGAATADEPSDEELARYIDGVAGSAERVRLEVRIGESPRSLARVAAVTAALQECGYLAAAAARPESPGARALRYAFQLGGDALSFLRGSTLPVAQAPALARRGGDSAAATGFFELHAPLAAGVAARLELERVAGGGVELSVRLDRGGAPLEGARITLRRDGRNIDSAATEQGRCVFRGLDAGRWEIEARQGGAPIGQVRIELLE